MILLQYVRSETLKKPTKTQGFLIFNFTLTNISGLGVSSVTDFERFGFGVGENSSGAVRERDGRDFVNIWVFSSPELMLWRNEGGELVLKILGKESYSY